MIGARVAVEPRDELRESILFVFSWFGLMLISVIVSGRLLGGVLRLPRKARKEETRSEGNRQEFLGIRLPGLLRLHANGDEVVLGFVALIIVLSALALLAGPAAYEMFVGRFGVDPGQFPALCVMSSFASVIVSVLVWMLATLGGAISGKADPVVREHAEIVHALSTKAGPGPGNEADPAPVRAANEEATGQ